MTSHRLVFSPLSLPGGWTARVLSKCHDVALTDGSPLRPPPVELWRPWLAALIADASHLPGCRRLKASESVEVLQARIPLSSDANGPALDVVCKRSLVVGFFDLALARFRRSRARRGFERALTLAEVGVGTAIPLALLERRGDGASWLVSLYLGEGTDLDAFALVHLPRLIGADARRARIAAGRAVAQLLADLHRARLHHRDLKASNLLLAKWNLSSSTNASADRSAAQESRTPRAYIVDLDGLSPRRSWRRGQRWHPLVRLAASLLEYPSIRRTDHARCLREYLARCGEDPARWRAHFADLARRAADYNRRARRRKSGRLDGLGAE